MTSLDEIFENQPKLISPEQAAQLVNGSRDTVYDWKYRPEKYSIPDTMFLKFGRKVLIRTDVFKKWFISRCA